MDKQCSAPKPCCNPSFAMNWLHLAESSSESWLALSWTKIVQLLRKIPPPHLQEHAIKPVSS
jgi:hypothetical protein